MIRSNPSPFDKLRVRNAHIFLMLSLSKHEAESEA
jgi:hypothetical protein